MINACFPEKTDIASDGYICGDPLCSVLYAGLYGKRTAGNRIRQTILWHRQSVVRLMMYCLAEAIVLDQPMAGLEC